MHIKFVGVNVKFFSENTVACPDCDMLQRIPAVPSGGSAKCSRCGHIIAVSKPDSLNRALAFTLAAAIVLIIANLAPLMGLQAVGRRSSTTIMGGVIKMWQTGQEITAILVAFCTVLAPTIYIGFMLTILLLVRKPPAPSWIGTLLRFSNFSQPWTMLEVMMLGILVALIKIADLATIFPDIGMFALGTLIILIAAINVSFDPHEIWMRIKWASGEARPKAASIESAGMREIKTIRSKDFDILTGKNLGLISCETCYLLTRPASDHESGYCPRCGQELALRRPDAIKRTWALLIAAAICYIPANLMPVMNTTTTSYTEKDTIMNGVVLLYESGSWPLALIVFIASVTIPLAKIITLTYLLISVQHYSAGNRRERVRLYRLVEFVGRWSMLDVFVVTFVVALVQLQPFMSVEPGAGVLFFAAVVVLTMLATQTFDPRLIWDCNNNSNSPSSGTFVGVVVGSSEYAKSTPASPPPSRRGVILNAKWNKENENG